MKANKLYFDNRAFIAAGFLNLSAVDAVELCKNYNALILDVRMASIARFKQFGVSSVISIPFNDLPESSNLIPHDIPVIVADSTGIKSREAILLLADKGFENIANLAGGFVDWERDSCPINIDHKQQLSGSCMCQLKTRKI